MGVDGLALGVLLHQHFFINRVARFVGIRYFNGLFLGHGARARHWQPDGREHRMGRVLVDHLGLQHRVILCALVDDLHQLAVLIEVEVAHVVLGQRFVGERGGRYRVPLLVNKLRRIDRVLHRHKAIDHVAHAVRQVALVVKSQVAVAGQVHVLQVLRAGEGLALVAYNQKAIAINHYVRGPAGRHVVLGAHVQVNGANGGAIAHLRRVFAAQLCRAVAAAPHSGVQGL